MTIKNVIDGEWYLHIAAFRVEEDTLKKYTPESILAHMLWELTWYGYEDERHLSLE